MSDSSGPHRIEVLESNVREMEAELFPTRAQIEQMMDTVQRLLQAKSADKGQQEETSGGSGRGNANDDNGGSGRAPREEGAASTKVDVATATAAGGRVASHSSRASDGSRPADDTGWRLEIPAGVGPMINMQRGKARDPFLAGIAAHDGNGVLSSGFQRQPRIVPPALKREKGISEFQA